MDTSVFICAQPWPEETSLFLLQLYTVIASAVTHKLQFLKTEVQSTLHKDRVFWNVTDLFQKHMNVVSQVVTERTQEPFQKYCRSTKSVWNSCGVTSKPGAHSLNSLKVGKPSAFENKLNFRNSLKPTLVNKVDKKSLNTFHQSGFLIKHKMWS